MDLNHLHLGSRDVAASRAFYETYLGFRHKFDHEMGVFLENEDGFLLAIKPIRHIPVLPEWFHLGFCLPDGASVKAVYDAMTAGGVPMAKEYAEYDDSAAAFYCLDPDGYRIEVSWHAVAS